ncbi:DUF421 domain-containing protein [Alkalihalobacillus pseudalcaliphilus]|uniref:DUF421 domain-containing protein n=1 Tax=Alkalihalobacillus pseudalcaliphilus TaxID=79884 RepID=UPI00064D7E99|nr:DUF421 domain-containing protein [Alkalihalobacillus pseudalcaliphilus]KMK76154.1 membrane protein [Alkalihalobacillus pseudalcaliphilus]
MPGWLEVTVRTIAALVSLFIISKVVVKKPIGESSFLEFALFTGTVMIAAISAVMLSIPPVLALLALVIWTLSIVSIYFIAIKSASFRTFFFGKGTAVIQEGKILEDALNKQHITGDELLRKLRQKDIFRFADVEFALLETNGELNVLLKDEKVQVIKRKSVKQSKQPETVIADGRILDESLGNRGLNRDWLQTELAKQDISLENVFLGQIDENGDLYVDVFDDSLQQVEPVTLPLLKAQIHKVQADLQSYALDTNNPEVKQTYQWCYNQITEAYLTLKGDLH